MSTGISEKKQLRRVPDPVWHFCLYITDGHPRSIRALENLQKLCDERFSGRYEIEVVDVVAQPRIALEENIVALPMLVRKAPKPIRKVIGDLSDMGRLLAGMDVPITA